MHDQTPEPLFDIPIPALDDKKAIKNSGEAPSADDAQNAKVSRWSLGRLFLTCFLGLICGMVLTLIFINGFSGLN